MTRSGAKQSMLPLHCWYDLQPRPKDMRKSQEHCSRVIWSSRWRFLKPEWDDMEILELQSLCAWRVWWVKWQQIVTDRQLSLTFCRSGIWLITMRAIHLSTSLYLLNLPSWSRSRYNVSVSLHQSNRDVWLISSQTWLLAWMFSNENQPMYAM